ncbi:rhamnogalacturonan lyase [uncultured Pseudokineococcus sp.]|uniref:rhamnogalacturonan lyase n=1 Tax=uncultured Pseudokineococcus sp. TaxID=1642928 RepID=UPI002623ECB9|nr:rhamnogalacturonan lyase [uncultured Pseudokineococcus sp.]
MSTRPTTTGHRTTRTVAAAAAAALVLGAAPAAASPAPGGASERTAAAAPGPRPQLELLDRGLVAAVTSDGVFLSWRLLATEAGAAGSAAAVDFEVSRDGQVLGTVSGSTNFLDADGAPDSVYRVVAVVDGSPVDRGAETTPWGEASLDVPLQKPADGTTPAGETYTYAANDLSVGDVDGDGQYELMVTWYPSNAKDVSQKGYTGPTMLDTYRMDGTLLARIDLGVNIRSGAHYSQPLVYDFDGDGKAELMVKTAPGTRSTTYRDGQPVAERHITMPAEDLAAGWSHEDDLRLSAEEYAAHLADVFQGWHAHPEVVAGSWPATIEEALGVEGEPASYPLSREDAEALVDHFIDVYAPARSSRNDLRTLEGFVLDGPEYLTVFDAGTGEELDTVRYEPGRHDDGLMWGDYAMSRIEPGNRVDRFLSGVAHLDGDRPSAIFGRGYYTRAVVVAHDWDGERISTRWTADSGWTPMSNPFDDGPHGVEGTDPEHGTLTTQGFHSLSAADVDGDGRHEVVYGSATLDHDGSLLYSSYDVMPEGSATPGVRAKLGHGDAMHVADIDPERPGLEIFSVHEGGAYAPYGWALRDAATGEVLAGEYSGRDTGRGMVGDVLPEVPGLEMWASMPGQAAGEILTARGEPVQGPRPLGTNQSIRWAADMTTQVLDRSGDGTPLVVDGRRGVLLEAEGTLTNNGTKGNAGLVADVLGDWREELLLRTEDSSAVRVHLSTEVTDRGIPTLMHDPQYRAEVARQQTSYNQPSYPSFHLGSGTDPAQVPVADLRAPGALDALARVLEGEVASGAVSGSTARQLRSALEQAQRHDDGGREAAAARALDRFRALLGRPAASAQVDEDAESVLDFQARATARLLDGAPRG